LSGANVQLNIQLRDEQPLDECERSQAKPEPVRQLAVSTTARAFRTLKAMECMLNAANEQRQMNKPVFGDAHE
jgi:hypothetical protein